MSEDLEQKILSELKYINEECFLIQHRNLEASAAHVLLNFNKYIKENNTTVTDNSFENIKRRLCNENEKLKYEIARLQDNENKLLNIISEVIKNEEK